MDEDFLDAIYGMEMFGSCLGSSSLSLSRQGLVGCVLSKPSPGCPSCSMVGSVLQKQMSFISCWKTFNTWLQGDLGYRGWYVSWTKVHLWLRLTVWPQWNCTLDTGCSLVTSQTKQITNCIAICQWVPFSPDDMNMTFCDISIVRPL